MRHLKLYILPLLIFIMVVGCKKDEIGRFSLSDSSAYFGQNSVQYSFIDTPDAEYYDLDVKVGFNGPIADTDRPINVELIEAKTSATPDQYEILEAVVPSGANAGRVKVRVKNASELDLKDLTLGFMLVGNDHFKVNYKDGEMVGGTSAVLYNNTQIVWSNQIKMPDYWLLANTHRYVTYTALYTDGTDLYGEAAAGRKVMSNKYTSAGLYSKRLAELLGELWPEKINVNGYLGKDEETIEKYPIFNVNTGGWSVILLHQLQDYIANYNLTHPGAPLRHSDDATAYITNGSVAKVNFEGKAYEVKVKGNPPIIVNPFNL